MSHFLFVPAQPGPASSLDFGNHTLILPCESVGNVGQLCVDLLATTLLSSQEQQLRRVGYIHSPALLPVVGNDAFLAPPQYSSEDVEHEHRHARPVGQLCTAMEVFHDPSRQLVLIQQRSPVTKDLRREFVTGLVQWISEQAFQKVYLLASIDANQRRDAQLIGSQFRHISAPSLMLLDTKLQELDVKPLEPPSLEFLGGRVSEKAKQRAMFYGSGLARRIFQQAVVFDLPLCVLFMFCTEGDNSADAYRFADKLNQLVKIVKSVPSSSTTASPAALRWTAPLAWDLFFGAPAHSSLF